MPVGYRIRSWKRCYFRERVTDALKAKRVSSLRATAYHLPIYHMGSRHPTQVKGVSGLVVRVSDS